VPSKVHLRCLTLQALDPVIHEQQERLRVVWPSTLHHFLHLPHIAHMMLRSSIALCLAMMMGTAVAQFVAPAFYKVRVQQLQQHRQFSRLGTLAGDYEHISAYRTPNRCTKLSSSA
jgi:hypothetical protein